MTTFREARSFLLQHRTDYDAAVKGFRWPDPVPFNWALDWFDAELARAPESKDRPALWIVDGDSGRETKLSFETLSRRSNQVANFLRAQDLARAIAFVAETPRGGFVTSIELQPEAPLASAPKERQQLKYPEGPPA